MALQSLDVMRRSASTTSPPQVRETLEVAKLIDVSKCIGCKACQVACMEWNDLRDDIGTNAGVYDNPRDLTDRSWTVMRFYEEELPGKGLQWLIVKDGCLHCEDPGCLRACPAPGAILKLRERGRRLPAGAVHRLRVLPDRLPVQRPALLRQGPEGLQVHALLRPDRGRARAGVHQDLPDAGPHLRLEGAHAGPRGRADPRAEGARVREGVDLRPGRRRRDARRLRPPARRPGPLPAAGERRDLAARRALAQRRREVARRRSRWSPCSSEGSSTT